MPDDWTRFGHASDAAWKSDACKACVPPMDMDTKPADLDHKSWLLIEAKRAWKDTAAIDGPSLR